jgi:osmotically-inducible protein OsmY
VQKLNNLIGGLALTAALALGASAQTPNTKHPAGHAMPAKSSGMSAAMKAAHAPKSDAEIEAAIKQRLAASPHLKDQGFNVAVSNGVATFTGVAKNPGSKGGVYNLAKASGAKRVINHIVVHQAAKSPAHGGAPAAKAPVKQ